jgi:hypothetical protein
MHVESDCPLSMWTMDNHFACCTICLSFPSPKKNSYPPPTPTKKKSRSH